MPRNSARLREREPSPAARRAAKDAYRQPRGPRELKAKPLGSWGNRKLTRKELELPDGRYLLAYGHADTAAPDA